MGWGQGKPQEAGSPAGIGSKARSLWCFLGTGAEPQVFSQPYVSGRTGSSRQERDLAGGYLAFTVPTAAEPESLQGPFARREQLRGLGLVDRRDPRLRTVRCYYWGSAHDTGPPPGQCLCSGTPGSLRTGNTAELLGQYPVRSRCSCWHRPRRQPLLQLSAATSHQASFTGLLPQSGETRARAGRRAGREQGKSRAQSRARVGREQGAVQGAAQVAAQGAAQGAEQGAAQGAAQGAEQGTAQGVAQGTEQGAAQGAEQGTGWERRRSSTS